MMKWLVFFGVIALALAIWTQQMAKQVASPQTVQPAMTPLNTGTTEPAAISQDASVVQETVGTLTHDQERLSHRSPPRPDPDPKPGEVIPQ